MKIRIFFLSLFLIYIHTAFLYPAEAIEISGMEVPVIEGARRVDYSRQAHIRAKIVNYTVDKPISEVVSFYTSFLRTNAFKVIGGLEAQGNFNAAVEKGDVRFSIHIYPEGGVTKLEFIW